jgi:hypothetical protein
MNRLRVPPWLIRFAVMMLTLVGLGWLFKLMFPTLDVNQIAVTATLLGLAYQSATDRREKEIAEAAARRELDVAEASARYKALEDRIAGIAVGLDKLYQEFATHREAYAHDGIHAAFMELVEKVYSNTAQVQSLYYSLKIDDRLDALESKVGGRRSGDRGEEKRG